MSIHLKMDIYTKRICVVTYTDSNYLYRAKKTIEDIRINGQFFGDLVVITDGLFQIDPRYILRMNLTVKEYPDIDTSQLIPKILHHPFNDTDGRELKKLKQWNKFYVFDTFFKQWDFVLFVDAGLRIFDKIDFFYPQFREDSIVAMDDGHPEFTKKFTSQIELSNTPIVDKLRSIYDINSNYFLNCIFLFDTCLITDTTLPDLITLMNEYPICKTNEMAIMNIYFHKNWSPMNIYLRNRVLFDWTERDGNTWKHYVSLKYPRTYHD
jgi:hypothetical protein